MPASCVVSGVWLFWLIHKLQLSYWGCERSHDWAGSGFVNQYWRCHFCQYHSPSSSVESTLCIVRRMCIYWLSMMNVPSSRTVPNRWTRQHVCPFTWKIIFITCALYQTMNFGCHNISYTYTQSCDMQLEIDISRSTEFNVVLGLYCDSIQVLLQSHLESLQSIVKEDLYLSKIRTWSA